MMGNFFFKFCLLLLVGLYAPKVHAADKLPNIVFIFADDLGWGDLGCYGHPYAKTPHLDKLASQGIMFKQFYVTGVTCCPTRAGIMTSKHPASYPKYMAKNGFGDRITITELLKKQGYTTGHFGKWHIGQLTKQTPVANGTYGIDEIEVIDNNWKDEGGRDADLFESAIKFIEKNQDKPFYVNVWGHISHYAVDPLPVLSAKFKDVKVNRDDFKPHMQSKFDHSYEIGEDLDVSMQNYLGDVYSLDIQVGLLLEKLDELGLAENTIVVFSSDHGPAPVRGSKKDYVTPGPNSGVVPSQNMLGYAGGFRGGKHQQYEGGIRAPFILRWPGSIPESKVNETSIISGMDWLPTLCHIAGIKIKADDFDGENIADIWLGADRSRKSPLFWKTNSVRSKPSLRDGKWKIHLKKEGSELYDLSVDVEENNNVADQYPDVVSNQEGIKEAMFSRRTAMWFENNIIGSTELLSPLFQKCVKIESTRYLENLAVVTINNTSGIDFTLENTGAYSFFVTIQVYKHLVKQPYLSLFDDLQNIPEGEK